MGLYVNGGALTPPPSFVPWRFQSKNAITTPVVVSGGGGIAGTIGAGGFGDIITPPLIVKIPARQGLRVKAFVASASDTTSSQNLTFTYSPQLRIEGSPYGLLHSLVNWSGVHFVQAAAGVKNPVLGNYPDTLTLTDYWLEDDDFSQLTAAGAGAAGAGLGFVGFWRVLNSAGGALGVSVQAVLTYELWARELGP